MKGEVSINIGGDLVVNKSYEVNRLQKDLITLFEKSDFNIVNLEAPVTSQIPGSAILKTGPHLRANQEAVSNVVKGLKINAVTLANNHILDYGLRGLKDTLDYCIECEIKTVGAGLSLEDAVEPLRLYIKGHKISIINFAENEWASATHSSGGSSPMDLIANINQIRNEKLQSDKVFVIVHGGHEYYNLPSPRMVEQYRFYVENGADLVVGHHTHCISGFEIYNNTPIYYGIGNFLFTKNNLSRDWYLGLVLNVQINSDGKIKTELYPIQQGEGDFSLSLQDSEMRKTTLSRIEEFNRIIADEKELDREWSNYIIKKRDLYLNYWSPLSFLNSKLIKKILIKTRLINFFVNKKGIALKLNLMRSEAHRDLSIEVLSKYLRKN